MNILKEAQDLSAEAEERAQKEYRGWVMRWTGIKVILISAGSAIVVATAGWEMLAGLWLFAMGFSKFETDTKLTEIRAKHYSKSGTEMLVRMGAKKEGDDVDE